MGELFDALTRKLVKKKEKVKIPAITVVQVRNSLGKMCDEHLQSPGDVFEFDVPERILPAVIEAINDNKLNSRFQITQSAPTLFLAQMRIEDV